MISKQDILNASILIINDQPSNIMLLEEMLRNAGYTSIASTCDPYEVWALHKKTQLRTDSAGPKNARHGWL